jgi:hypothetical protein
MNRYNLLAFFLVFCWLLYGQLLLLSFAALALPVLILAVVVAQLCCFGLSNYVLVLVQGSSPGLQLCISLLYSWS